MKQCPNPFSLTLLILKRVSLSHQSHPTTKPQRKREHAPARANKAIRTVSSTKKSKCHKRRVPRQSCREKRVNIASTSTSQPLPHSSPSSSRFTPHPDMSPRQASDCERIRSLRGYKTKHFYQKRVLLEICNLLLHSLY